MQETGANASVSFVGIPGKVELGRPATYEDLLELPEHVVAELIDGQMFTQARRRARHTWAQSRLSTVIASEFEDGIGREGGWVVLGEPELHLVGSVLVPDLAAWRVDHFPRVSGDESGIDVAPDWVCELLSPSTQTKDRFLKLPRYGEAGVRWTWLVDPAAETVKVYRRDDGAWMLAQTVMSRGAVFLPPFESLEIPLEKIWVRERSAER